MRIANNIPALMTHINMRRNDRMMSAAMQRLSSGMRINSAREDAAGLAIATKLSYQVTGLERASSNSTHGISMIQTAEGALNEIHNMLQRMRELSVQAANDSSTIEDRAKMQQELDELTDEISAAAGRAEFNQIKLLNGEASRVNTNWHAGRVNAVIAAATFISENVPSGTLHYTIQRVGLPAEVIGGNAIQFDHTLEDRIRPAVANINPSGTVDGDAMLQINEYILQLRDGDDFAAVFSRALNGPPDGVLSGSEEDIYYRGVERMTGLMMVTGFGTSSLATTDDNHDRAINIFSANEDLLINNLGLAPAGLSETQIGTPLTASLSGNVHDFFGVDTSIEHPQVPAVAAGTFTLTLPDGSTRDVVINEGDYIMDVIAEINAIDLAGTGVRVLETGERAFAFETIATGDDQILRMSTDNPVLTNLLGITTAVSLGSSGMGFRFTDVGSDGTGRITINGVQIDVTTSDTYATIRSRIVEASHAGGFSFREVEHADGYTVLLTSAVAGSAQRIHVEGDPHLLAFFGLQPSYSRGTDAEITASMVDRRGNNLRDFNNSMAITSDGNQVTIVSAHGAAIHKNIQVRPNPDPDISGSRTPITAPDNPALPTPESPFPVARFEADPQFFTYGDGATLVAGGEAGATDMQLRIENFGPIKLQIGPNFNQNMDVNIPRLNAETLRLAEHKGGQMHRLVNIMTHESAERAINQVNDAINMVSRIRSRLGAYQNRLEATVRNLDTAAENTAGARSRIQDTDMAREMTAYSQRNVMFQAGVAILGQANQRPQMILQLLN